MQTVPYCSVFLVECSHMETDLDWNLWKVHYFSGNMFEATFYSCVHVSFQRSRKAELGSLHVSIICKASKFFDDYEILFIIKIMF